MIRASDGDGAPVAPPDAYPEGFHAWPIEKRNEFFANAVARLAPKRQTTAEVLRLDPKDTKPLRFPLERALDFEPPTSSDWLIKGLLPKEGIGTLFGASGEYKTFTAIHLCLHIATGEPWGGRKVKHNGTAIGCPVTSAASSLRFITSATMPREGNAAGLGSEATLTRAYPARSRRGCGRQSPSRR
jgi:AAA domain